jgi:hypothetical protein
MIPLGRPDLGLDLYMLREAPSATPTTNIIVRRGGIGEGHRMRADDVVAVALGAPATAPEGGVRSWRS